MLSYLNHLLLAYKIHIYSYRTFSLKGKNKYHYSLSHTLYVLDMYENHFRSLLTAAASQILTGMTQEDMM